MITMRLKNRPAVTHTVEITINDANESFVAYIDGPDQLRLDRYGTYNLVHNDIILDAKITIVPDEDDKRSLEEKLREPSKYASIKSDKDQDNNTIYVLHANNKNKLGKLVLTTTYENKEYTKTVEIIPLWWGELNGGSRTNPKKIFSHGRERI